MSALRQLADAVGLQRHWRAADGGEHEVADETLARLVGLLGYPAEDDAAIARSLAQRADRVRAVPPLLTMDAGAWLELPAALAHADAADLRLESGGDRPLAVSNGWLEAIAEPGYHRLAIAGHELTLAVAPARCFALAETGRSRIWGAGVQIASLRSDAERAYGGLSELREAARAFAALGADALAISPVHALNPGHPQAVSPYWPSSRRFLNILLADPALVGLPGLPDERGAGTLIDWERAVPRRIAALRGAYAAIGPAQRAVVAAWAEREGAPLARQALFDALSSRFGAEGLACWQDWPAAYRDPDGAAAGAYALANADEVGFFTFAQWLARQGLSLAQGTARARGMALGLVSDLAVGVAPGGADAWSLGDTMFQGLGIGAPPDPLGPEGQAWGITAFTPEGLVASGFAPWLAMLRAALADAGGVRIDHAFGLSRLWIVPDGLSAAQGAYLTLPFADLQRLVALESHRARALVIAEDLGTAPWGFAGDIAGRGMLGMRLMWFEREWDGGFRAPQAYDAHAVAMTGTHDTATVAGWWRGIDIGWRKALGHLPTPEAMETAEGERARARQQLWTRIGEGVPQPAPDDPDPAVAAALRHVGAAASEAAIVPLEDILALEQQVNVPGTIDEHPNWRRRLPAPLAGMLAGLASAARIAALAATRGR